MKGELMKKLVSFVFILIMLTSCNHQKIPPSPNLNLNKDIVEEKEEIPKEEPIINEPEESTNKVEEEIKTPMTEIWCKNPLSTTEGLHPIVLEARTHLGNVNGELFWKWYGFNSYTAWCACFVSYCASETNVDIPKFAWVPNGEQYFKSIDKWETPENYIPKSGDIIFFVYNDWPEACHVGIVECVIGNRVYTIEGNWNNSCQRAYYPLDWHTIMGYGVI
jgi:hypothetical protein